MEDSPVGCTRVWRRLSSPALQTRYPGPRNQDGRNYPRKDSYEKDEGGEKELKGGEKKG